MNDDDYAVSMLDRYMRNFVVNNTTNWHTHAIRPILAVEEVEEPVTITTSKHLPFSRFCRDFLSDSELATMLRTRVLVSNFGDDEENWLHDNCTDLFTFNDLGSKTEVMFHSPEDMALFMLATA